MNRVAGKKRNSENTGLNSGGIQGVGVKIDPAAMVHITGSLTVVTRATAIFTEMKVFISIDPTGAGSSASLMRHITLIDDLVGRFLAKFEISPLCESGMIIQVILNRLIRNFLDAFLITDNCEQPHNVRIG